MIKKDFRLAKELTSTFTLKLLFSNVNLDALNDFGKPPPQPKQRPSAAGSSSRMQSEEMNQAWSEEFIKEATAQFEKKMREYVNSGSEQS
jgi:hypothetical protein